MFAGSGDASTIGAAATITAGGSGSRDTTTTAIIITGTIISIGTITTAGIVTDPESCCVSDSGATAVLRRVFHTGRPAVLF
jgi:hypothetical protein